MRIPYVTVRSAGLHMDEAEISWVELERRGKTVRVISAERVRRHHNEPVSEALSRLLGRITPQATFVSVHFFSGPTRFVFRNTDEGLAGDDADLLQEALAEESGRFDGLSETEPARYNTERTIRYAENDRESPSLSTIRTAELQHDEAGKKVLIVGADTADINQSIEVVHRAGLVPAAVSPGHLSTGYAYVLEPDFVENSSLLLEVDREGVFLSQYRNGVLDWMRAVHTGPFTDVVWMEEQLVTAVQSLPDEGPIWVCGTQADRLTLINIQRETKRVRPFQSVIGLDQACAAALAVQGLYSALPRINLLEPDAQDRAWQIIEKSMAYRSILVLGILFMVILITLFGARSYVSAQIERQKPALTEALTLQAMLMARSVSVSDLRVRLEEATKARYERTASASLLESLGGIAGGDTWLRSAAITTTREGAQRLTLEGYSLHETLVAAYVNQLERLERIESVNLVSLQTMDSLEVLDMTGFLERTLERFEIEGRATRMNGHPRE